MSLPPRVLRSIRFAVLFLLLALPSLRAGASTLDLEFHDCSYEEGLGQGECQHFLRNPAGATDDPCWCDKCRNGVTGQRHDGKTLPPGWSASLLQTGGMDCYLKRHSVAWGITCSECYGNSAAWPDGGGGKDVGTVPENDFAGRPARKTLQDRLVAEQRFFKKPDDAILAYNRHFYVVTDIEGLKVQMPSGSGRAISKHEWLHLMIERAEFARREWVRNMGSPSAEQPIAIFLTERQRDCESMAATYFRGATSKALRGSGASICEKMCLTGIGMSKQKTGDDIALQVGVRHQLSHNLFSIWGSWQIRPKSMPVWLDEGLSHWLTKTLPKLRDEATYCVGESQNGNGPGWGTKDWEKDVVGYLNSGRLCLIEELLGKPEIKHLGEEDVKRSWSYVDLCLSEWREPFVKLAEALRQEKDLREAFTGSLGCTPEMFEERWRDRVLGRRKSMAPIASDDDATANTPGARDRRAIRSEADPRTLAAKVRALGEITDKKTIPVVLDVIARNSDMVRETAFVTLLKTKDTECVDAIWNYGLAHDDAMVRAYTAKLCGRLALEFAIPKLEAQLADKNWYARAEAAVACGLLKDAKAMSAMRKIVTSDTSQKAQVGAIDALAMFGEDAAASVPAIAKHVESSQWQLRIASIQALGTIGSMEGVEALVTRMEVERGRIADEVYEALKKISRDDLGRKPEFWRQWWEKEKARAPGGVPQRPAEREKPTGPAAPDPHSTTDGGPPPSFGIEIYSNRVAWVIDTTETMLTLFHADPSGAKSLSRDYTGRDKLTICKEEIAQALKALDSRAHFNIVAFGMQIRAFKQNPVAASGGNIDSAIGFLRGFTGSGRTNYYGALKAALDLGEEPDTNSDFRSTPDTITFLTDGMPNEGDIIDADTLVEWYTGLNRYARVKTHTLTFGTVGVDQPLLRNLAERNGGKFTIVPELKSQSR